MSANPQSSDLKNRIIFTIFILSIYRLGTFIPLPGINPDQLQILMEGNQKGLLGMFNVFAGGAISRMAIFALGIMPYISSSIIVQLLTGVSDYFKNLKSQGEIGRKKISQITRSLKNLAKEIEVPIIALSQLSRAVENRSDRRPQLSDLRESGAIEQDADVVIFLYRPWVYSKEDDDRGKAEIIVAKQRNGPTGLVEATFIDRFARFENMSSFASELEEEKVFSG